MHIHRYLCVYVISELGWAVTGQWVHLTSLGWGPGGSFSVWLLQGSGRGLEHVEMKILFKFSTDLRLGIVWCVEQPGCCLLPVGGKANPTGLALCHPCNKEFPALALQGRLSFQLPHQWSLFPLAAVGSTAGLAVETLLPCVISVLQSSNQGC